MKLLKSIVCIILVLCLCACGVQPGAEETQEGTQGAAQEGAVGPNLSDYKLPESSPAYGNGLTDAQNVIIQTALSYFYKGNAVQYCSCSMSDGKRNIAQIVHLTNNRSPEDSSIYNTHYTVCSGYPHDTYYNALGYHLLNPADMPNILFRLQQPLSKDYYEYTAEELNEINGLVCTTIYLTEYAYDLRSQGKNDLVPYFYSSLTAAGSSPQHKAEYVDGSTTEMTDAEIQAMIDGMQPGDIIVSYNHKNDSGHAMIYLGETNYQGRKLQYVIHSSGYGFSSKANDNATIGGQKIQNYNRVEAPTSWYNRKENLTLDGTQFLEDYNLVLPEGGSIVVDTAQNLFGHGKTYEPKDYTSFVVIRPLAHESVLNSAVTHDAIARMQYPALEITKTASVLPYNSVQPGDEITYTIELKNHTNQAMYVTPTEYLDVWVKETIPAGTSCPDAVDGVVTFEDVYVLPGTTTELTYTVTVDETMKRGDTIVSPAGQVGGASCADGWFETSQLTNTVEGERPQGIDETIAISGAGEDDTDVAEAVYAAAGYTGVKLPSSQEIVDTLLDTITIETETDKNKAKLAFKDFTTLTGDEALLAQMLVPGYTGGKQLHTVSDAGIKTNTNRLRDYNEGFLQPGDILLYANIINGTKMINAGTTEIYVYLGNGKFATNGDGGYTIIDAPIETYVQGGIPYTDDLNDSTYYTWKYEYSKVFTELMAKSFFVCLRPSLAYDTLPQ